MELKNAINEMKHSLENIGNRANHMEEKTKKLNNRNLERMQVEEEREIRLLKYV